MQKVIILQGPPASGKSTWARSFVKNKSDRWIIVNRDSIRSMLGDYWVPGREVLVTEIEHSTITTALDHGYNVIVDATNLNNKTLKKLRRLSTGCDITIKKFETPIILSVLRDIKRGLLGGRCVGFKVIRSFYKRYNL
jgi:predicted kinase